MIKTEIDRKGWKVKRERDREREREKEREKIERYDSSHHLIKIAFERQNAYILGFNFSPTFYFFSQPGCRAAVEIWTLSVAITDIRAVYKQELITQQLPYS